MEDTENLDRKGSKERQQWRIDSLFIRDKLNLAHSYKPYTTRSPRPRMLGVPDSERMRDLLDVAEADRLRRGLSSDGFYCDLSQSVRRCPWGPLRTLTVNSAVYDFGREMVLSPLEEMALQGFPAVELASSAGLRDPSVVCSWAGQAMFVPCVAALKLAYFLNSWGPWWKEQRVADSATSECSQHMAPQKKQRTT